jgi:hypothetical protein
MTYVGPVPPVSLRDKIAFKHDRIRGRIRNFFTQPKESNSTFGKTLQALGVLGALAGLYLVYPPLAFLVGGAFLVFFGEHI